jgi:hypothetical protein
MDPKDLRRLHDQIVADQAEAEAQARAEEAEREQRVQDCKLALRNVVIPYLDEVDKALPRGTFSHRVVGVDTDGAPMEVGFRYGAWFETRIKTVDGEVLIATFEPNAEGWADPESVLSPNDEPYIEGPDDLTREKIGQLIEIIMRDSTE